MTNIRDKLKQARLTANLSQEVLAEKIGVSRQTVSNWENGRSYPDIASIIVLSDIYGIALDTLLKGDKEIVKHFRKNTNMIRSYKLVILLLLFMTGFLLSFYGTQFPIYGTILKTTGFIGGGICVIIILLNLFKFIKPKITITEEIKVSIIAKEKELSYQYGEYKIELKPSLGNFELYINGELKDTTKGGAKFQLSSDMYLTAKLPSGEDVLAIKKAKVKENELILMVGQMLSPQ